MGELACRAVLACTLHCCGGRRRRSERKVSPPSRPHERSFLRALQPLEALEDTLLGGCQMFLGTGPVLLVSARPRLERRGEEGLALHRHSPKALRGAQSEGGVRAGPAGMPE